MNILNENIKLHIAIDCGSIKMYRLSQITTLAVQNVPLIIGIFQVQYILCSDNETRLIDNLLYKYQPYSRPVANASSPLLLDITITLKQIIDLDERNQLLTTNLWLEYYWFDSKLVWNPVSVM